MADKDSGDGDGVIGEDAYTEGQEKINDIEDKFEEISDVFNLMNEPDVDSLQEVKELANAAIAMIDELISELEQQEGDKNG